jgi:hypothetical protein
MLTVAIISAWLFGLTTLFLMLRSVFIWRSHRSRVLKMIAAFGAIGLLIPSTVTALDLTGHNDSLESARFLWPGSIMLMALDSPTEPTSNIVLVFAMAILSNVGLYGFVGLCAGGIWVWIRPNKFNGLGE